MGLFAKTKKNIGSIAISLRDDGIYAASVKRTSAKPIVELVAFYPGSKSAPIALLQKLAKDLHTDRYGCSSVLAADEYQLLSVDAPNVPQEELKTAIRWRLKDMLDFHVDDATIDVLDIPLDKNAAVRSHSMYAVAAHNQKIEKHQALFSGAKIPLSVIDIPEMAQRNIAELLESEGRGLALLSFDTDGGLLTVTFAGELYLSRRIDVPLAQLTQSDADQQNACYEKITLELQRSLDHFDRQHHSVPVAKLVLSPIGAAASGLKEYLSTNLYVLVETLDLDSILDLDKTPELKSLDMQQRYFLTLGTALRHEEKVL